MKKKITGEQQAKALKVNVFDDYLSSELVSGMVHTTEKIANRYCNLC